MDEERALIQMADLFGKAMLTNNVEQIAQFISSDWIIVGANGITGRYDFLESIRSGSVAHNRLETDEVTAKIYENTGVVIRRGASAGITCNQPFDLYEWSTNLFVRHGDAWLCAATLITPANRK